jgi:hypothetical protein
MKLILLKRVLKGALRSTLKGVLMKHTRKLLRKGNNKSAKRKSRRSGGGCGCGIPKPSLIRENNVAFRMVRGGGCPCQGVQAIPIPLGGYRPTASNLKYLKKWKRGESIGFTMRSSLKAKGLIPRADGKKRVSAKYRQ